MLGAITGDVVGSVYEFANTKDYHFKLLSKDSNYTDDSVMTVAVADWLLTDPELSYQGLEDLMLAYAREHPCPMGDYGGGFRTWLFQPERLYDYDDRNGRLPYRSTTGRHPYGSWGNGSAMRASAVGWCFDTLEETERVAEISAAITHNHPEGIKGAQATAAAVWMARSGKSQEDIRSYISSRFGYDLYKTYRDWHPSYHWEDSCQGTVPQAIICFLDSTDFEDALRKAVSLGGDSDTLACITGGIAEAFYGGVPGKLASKILKLLPDRFLSVLGTLQSRTAYGRVCPIDDARVRKFLDEDARHALALWTDGLGNSARRFRGEDPMPEKKKIATRDSWNTRPMPEKQVTVPLDLRLTGEQMERIRCGHIPDGMEDHWFMYCDDERIRYYRSWTGNCIFEAAFEASGDGYRVTRLTINQDPEEHKARSEQATRLFAALLMEESGADAGPYWDAYFKS